MRCKICNGSTKPSIEAFGEITGVPVWSCLNITCRHRGVSEEAGILFDRIHDRTYVSTRRDVSYDTLLRQVLREVKP